MPQVKYHQPTECVYETDKIHICFQGSSVVVTKVIVTVKMFALSLWITTRVLAPSLYKCAVLWRVFYAVFALIVNTSIWKESDILPHAEFLCSRYERKQRGHRQTRKIRIKIMSGRVGYLSISIYLSFYVCVCVAETYFSKAMREKRNSQLQFPIGLLIMKMKSP